MTRLKSELVSPMVKGMADYNNILQKKTGLNLTTLTGEIFKKSESALQNERRTNKIGVIPITQGQGIIGSFSEAIASIVISMGFEAYVTKRTDVDGIYEACTNGCNILFFADDERYLALNKSTGKVGENDYCTALGYIKVLEKLMERQGKNIRGEKILQIGYGRVGKQALSILTDMGISADVYDKDEKKLDALDSELKIYNNISKFNISFSEPVIPELKAGDANERQSKSMPVIRVMRDGSKIREYKYILDFTNEGPWLDSQDINPDTLYASPGVPLSLTREAAIMLGDRAVYDNLEIGTAVMLESTII